MNLNNKRIFIRNADRTGDIDRIRFLSDDKIGIIFKGSPFEYSYNKSNVLIQSTEDIEIQSEFELEKKKKIEEEQIVLDEILDIIRKAKEEYEHILRRSPDMKNYWDDLPSIERALEPYVNLLDNPYFAKFKFAGDTCSYYISEHNINKLPRELQLPQNTHIISVYSNLGKNVYNLSKTFYANSPMLKKRKLYDNNGYEIYVYNDRCCLDQSATICYDVVQKYRFDIRNGKIIGLSDETPR